jgi:hypothetical protein
MKRLFETWKDRGGSGDPSQFWLEQLLYLLETNHEDLVGDTGDDNNASANTYKYFVENYGLQIWKEPPGRNSSGSGIAIFQTYYYIPPVRARET